MRKIILLIFLISQTGPVYSQDVARKYDDAMEAYNKGLYGQANRLFEQFLQEYDLVDEQYATALYFSSESLFNLGNTDAASAGFEYIVNNFHWSAFRDRALYKLGIMYFNSGQFPKSREKFQELLNEYPESDYVGSALYWVGESFTSENRLQDAINFLEEAAAKRKDNRYIDYSIYTLASTYEKTGQYEKAVKYYDQLLSFHRESPLASAAQKRIGICYFKLKDYESSILELNSPLLQKLPPGLFAESLYLLANAHYRTREYNKAQEIFIKLIKDYPFSDFRRDAEYGLAWTYFQKKEFNNAYNLFNSLSAGKDSIAERSFYWKGETKRYLGQDTQAFDIFKEFARKFPDSELQGGVQYQMGVLYFDNNQLNDAEETIRNSLSSEDDFIKARSYTLLGEIDLNKKRFAKAKENFETALQNGSVSDDLAFRAKFGLGVSLYYMKSFNEAITILQELEKQNPSFKPDEVNFYIGESFYAQGKYSDALLKYSKVRQNSKFSSMALYGKGYSYFNLKDYENAAYAFNDFIKEYPDDKRITDTRLRLADSYYGSKNYSAASRVYKNLFNIGGGELNNSYTYYQFAQALYKAGNVDEAIREFQALAEKFPDSDYSDESLFTIAWIHFQQNNFREAISKYRNVLNVYPGSALSPIVYYSIGDAYFNMGRYDSAIANYEKVMSQYPGSNYVFDAVNGIQYSYIARGEPEKAAALLDEFVSRNPGLSFSDQLSYKRGEIYYSVREYEKARTSYQQFIANYPRSRFVPDAYYWIGKSAQNLNQTEDAIQSFTRTFEQYPQDEIAAASVIELGNIYSSEKNYDASLNIYNKAIAKLSKSSRLPEILFMKGLALLNKNDMSSAYEVFNEIIVYHKKSAFAGKAKFEVALIAMAAEKYENADIYLKALAEEKSDDLGAKAQYYYGISLLEQGKYEDAIKAFERVRLVFSSYDEWLMKSYLKLGETFAKLEEVDKAKEMYRAVLAKHKGDELGAEAQNKLRELQ